ncbi:MAG TPA: radical SAM protein [Thermoanaerobaculia bacterium]|jgi:MoaA/NifB/PqqE/SkfB family radical SAM enzyme
MRGSHGWAEVSRERKREIINAIVANEPTRGPVHAELDLTDRCNVACYFCNQQDLRTKEAIPLPKLQSLVDEMAGSGLKSVRLSGGGDPLFHRDVVGLLDHLAARNVIVDNVTTNAVALTEEIARHLVANKAREVVVSLNAADRDDYARMMKVKPALFDKVVENVQRLMAIRGEAMHPGVVVQFLVDRRNLERAVDMYDVGRRMGVDRIAFNAVLEIPRDRIDEDLLLQDDDAARAEPVLRELLRRDAEAGLLQIDFPFPQWNDVLTKLRAELAVPEENALAKSTAFREDNGGCFFAWYTAAITGNGDIRPCCLLLNPDVKPLGNVHETATFAEQWNGPAFATMRSEMREVLLMKSRVHYSKRKFEVLEEPCVTRGRCWLKNVYFRADEEFYTELGTALDEMRAKEIRLFGDRQQRRRAITLFVQSNAPLKKTWDWIRESSRPIRIFVKKRLGVNVTDAG